MSLEERLRGEPPVRAVREALGGDHPGWIVGGTVRDALLRRPIRDVDLAVAGEAEPAARSVASAVGGPVFPLSEAFGAWRVIERARNFVCDVSPLQGETIEADLAGRDFTVNAMAVPIEGGAMLDPHGGAADVEARVLRVVGPDAYREDALRPLRLVRLSAELGLHPEPGTEGLTREAAPRVAGASPERIFGELRRLLLAERPLAGIELADRLGVLGAVLPEVAALRGVEQSHFHHLDVYGHTMEVLARQLEVEASLDQLFGDLASRVASVLDEPLADELTRGQALRFAALLHDVGKPATRGVLPGGRITFIGHDAVGEGMVRDLCRRLRTSERFAQYLAGVTRHHLVLGFLVHDRPLPRRTVYRYLKTTSPVEVEVTLLSCADRLATRGERADAAIAAHLELAREVMRAALEWRAEGPARAPIRGDELADALGIERGPELGRILRALEEAAYAGEIATAADAVELGRRLRNGADA